METRKLLVYWHCKTCGLEGFGQNSKDDHEKEHPNSVFESEYKDIEGKKC